jgi:Cellulase (glycosyl hydrolase family 5)
MARRPRTPATQLTRARSPYVEAIARRTLPAPGAPRAQCSRPRHPVRSLLTLAVLSLVSIAALAPHAEPARAYGLALRTAVATDSPFDRDGQLMLAHIREAGAQLVRIDIGWNLVAPASPPPGFQPANPSDPGYDWREADRAIDQVVAAGLEPIVDIGAPPTWAQAPPGAGPLSPEPVQYGQFAAAAARRYDGSTPGQPRVRYWDVWNEPNASYFLRPQTLAGQIVSVNTYRAMLESFATAVHGVAPDNVVIGGELFPNGVDDATVTAIAPLDFTRRLFCISAGARPRRICAVHVPVDVWSVHPYTSGSPTTLPANPDNIWLSNLSSLTAAVRSAQRLGTLVAARPAQVWVTESSWDSNPPDPRGVPVKIEQRWVAEAIYRSWVSGIGVFTWFSLRDEALGASPFQSGLYFECSAGVACDTPKPAEEAFRFPFVAYGQRRHRVLVWGRTPVGVPGTVQVQWLAGTRWRGLVKLSTDGDGIFTARVALPRRASATTALLRAVRLGAVEPSPAFSLQPPPNLPVTPFGVG